MLFIEFLCILLVFLWLAILHLLILNDNWPLDVLKISTILLRYTLTDILHHRFNLRLWHCPKHMHALVANDLELLRAILLNNVIFLRYLLLQVTDISTLHINVILY